MDILLVDDEPMVLAGLARSLSRRVGVACATSAREAFELLGKRPFDAVVADYLMPDTNGLALLHTVRALYPATRRLLMSAGPVPDLDDPIASGIVEAFLEKPFTVSQLMDALSRE
jgi:two-component system response regulator YesN